MGIISQSFEEMKWLFGMAQNLRFPVCRESIVYHSVSTLRA